MFGFFDKTPPTQEEIPQQEVNPYFSDNAPPPMVAQQDIPQNLQSNPYFNESDFGVNYTPAPVPVAPIVQAPVAQNTPRFDAPVKELEEQGLNYTPANDYQYQEPELKAPDSVKIPTPKTPSKTPIKSEFSEKPEMIEGLWADLKLNDNPQGKAFMDAFNDETKRAALLSNPLVVEALEGLRLEGEKQRLQAWSNGELDEGTAEILAKEAKEKGGVMQSLALDKASYPQQQFMINNMIEQAKTRELKDVTKRIPLVVDESNIKERAKLTIKDATSRLPKEVVAKNPNKYAREVQPILSKGISEAISKNPQLKEALDANQALIESTPQHAGGLRLKSTFKPAEIGGSAPVAHEEASKKLGFSSSKEMDTFLSFTKENEGGIYLTPYVLGVGNSGVTVGSGVDVGQHSIADLENLFKGSKVEPTVIKSIVGKLAPYTAFGHGQINSKNVATHLLKDAAEKGTMPVLTPEEAVVLSYAKAIDSFSPTTKVANYANTPPALKQVMYDAAVQHGQWGTTNVNKQMIDIANSDLGNNEKNAQLKEVVSKAWGNQTEAPRLAKRLAKIDDAFPIVKSKK